MKKLVSVLFAIMFIVSSNVSAIAADYKIGELEIIHPHARATLPKARVSGGYLTIKNHGEIDDTLIDVRVEFAGKSEIHEMSMQGDVMKMRALENGLLLPAGQTVKLMPGGYHLMFMQMKRALVEEERHKAILVFEKAGELEIEFIVESMKTMRERAKHEMHDGMKDSKMDHSKMKH